MNLMYNDKVKKLLERAQQQGFVLEKDKKAFKLYPPDKTKPIVVISLTPSDHNVYWEIRRQLRKSGFAE